MQIIETEEDYYDESYDEVDGKINALHAQKRIDSDWYGPQDPERLRMDYETTLKALQQKAGCSEQDIEGNGLYCLTHLPTRENYIGKAQKQSLGKRLIQHLNKATSDRPLTGNVDRLLREHPNAKEWDINVFPLDEDKVGGAEAICIRKLKPSLNVQQPQAGLY